MVRDRYRSSECVFFKYTFIYYKTQYKCIRGYLKVVNAFERYIPLLNKVEIVEKVKGLGK